MNLYYAKNKEIIMFTINLEKKLVAQNKQVATPEELLLIREFDRKTELVENDVLLRLGMTKSLRAGKETKNYKNTLKGETEVFNQEKVFHISQIQDICQKYYLRFLPASYYQGDIDPALPGKITTFETAYGVKCTSGYVSRWNEPHGVNSYIMAPKESFKLEEKPKDPLFFYQINSEYFYLVHKWGNDLSIFRRCLSFFTSPFACYITLVSCLWLISLLVFSINGALLAGSISSVACALWWLLSAGIEEEPVRFVAENEWNSTFR